MDLIFTGTGAADFFHTSFCAGENCSSARLEGGKSIRSSSGLLLEDMLLLDASWGAYAFFSEAPRARLPVKIHIDHPQPFRSLSAPCGGNIS